MSVLEQLLKKKEGEVKGESTTTVADILKRNRYFRGALLGEPDSGKTTTSGTLTPGRGTCVVCTVPVSQMIVHDPEVRVFEAKTFDQCIAALTAPEKFFGDDIETLVWDDATITINRGLEEKGVVTAADPRQIYKAVQFPLEGALLHPINKPFHFIVIGQARRMKNEISGLDEITIDVPPSMENSIVQVMDYAFFVQREDKTGPAKLITIPQGRKIVTKLKLTKDQFGKIPVANIEEADLARVWMKLTNPLKGTIWEEKSLK